MNEFPAIPMDSMAGLAEFYFVEAAGIIYLPDPVQGIVSAPVILKAGYSWTKGYATQDTLQYSEPSKQTAHGTHYTAALKGFVPDEKSIRQQLIAMDTKKYIVLFTDNDGQKKIGGTLEYPFEFNSDYESQTTSGGEKGYNYQFATLLIKKAPVYDCDFIEITDGSFYPSLYDTVITTSYNDAGYPLVTNFYYQGELVFTWTMEYNSLNHLTRRQIQTY